MDTVNASPSGRAIIKEREAARRCGLSYVTMRRLRDSGTGPAFLRLTERRIAYKICDVEAWLDSRLPRAA